MAEQKEGANQLSRLYLLTYPRSASNLLVRILALEDQPNVKSCKMGGYFFLPAVQLIKQLKLRGKHVREWTEDERDQMVRCYQACFEELEEYAKAAKAEGKIAFVKEHIYFVAEPTAMTNFLFGKNSLSESPWRVQVPPTYESKTTGSSINETVLPDEFLRTWMPTFLIRHPALAFPSHYRAIIDLEGVEFAESDGAHLPLHLTLHWTRTLYEWYIQNLSQSGYTSSSDTDLSWPLVLDADDIITEPEVITRFCEIVGLDPSELKSSWKPASKEELQHITNAAEKRMLSTLLGSAGVIQGKTSINLDIDKEAKAWREEFGERQGRNMEKYVKEAMPDYEWMRAKRLRRNLGP